MNLDNECSINVIIFYNLNKKCISDIIISGGLFKIGNKWTIKFDWTTGF